MKFVSILASAAMVACANALAAFGNSEYNVQAGKPFTLTWLGQDSRTVDLKLKNGPKGMLLDVLTIKANATGTEYTWTPPATLPSDTYAFEIIDGGVPNWSPQFRFVGAAPTSTSTSVTSTTSTATSTSSPTSSGTSSAPTSSSTTGPSQTSQGPRPTQSGGTLLPPNSGLKSQSSPLALVAVMVATLFFLN